MHRSPVNYLTAEVKPGKSHLGNPLMKAVRPVVVSMWSLTCKWRRHYRTVRQGGRRKERSKEWGVRIKKKVGKSLRMCDAIWLKLRKIWCQRTFTESPNKYFLRISLVCESQWNLGYLNTRTSFEEHCPHHHLFSNALQYRLMFFHKKSYNVSYRFYIHGDKIFSPRGYQNSRLSIGSPLQIVFPSRQFNPIFKILLL